MKGLTRMLLKIAEFVLLLGGFVICIGLVFFLPAALIAVNNGSEMPVLYCLVQVVLLLIGCVCSFFASKLVIKFIRRLTK